MRNVCSLTEVALDEWLEWVSPQLMGTFSVLIGGGNSKAPLYIIKQHIHLHVGTWLYVLHII